MLSAIRTLAFAFLGVISCFSLAHAAPSAVIGSESIVRVGKLTCGLVGGAYLPGTLLASGNFLAAIVELEAATSQRNELRALLKSKKLSAAQRRAVARRLKKVDEALRRISRLNTNANKRICGELEVPTASDDHISDIKNWRKLGLPLASEWNTVGFSLQWHVDQVRAGHRVLPSIALPTLTSGMPGSQSNMPSFVERALALTPESWDFLKETSLPFCLRTNNLANSFAADHFRLPIEPKNILPSPLVWKMTNGILDDSFVIDSFGPISNWTKEGHSWSQYLLAKTLQERLPNPAYIVFTENNEGAYEDGLGRYVDRDRDRTNAVGMPLKHWKPQAELATLHLRLMHYLEQNPGVTPDEFLLTFWKQHQAHYWAAFQAFENGLIPSWRGKITTAAYNAMSDARWARPSLYPDELGYAPQLTYYDAGSEPIYSTGGQYTDFTSLDQVSFLNLIPAWEAAEKRNPDAHRELILHISNGGVFRGARDGAHEVMTPARYQAFVEWLLWSIQSPGKPVAIRHWVGSKTTPDTRLFESKHFAELTALGAPELKNAVVEDYVTPIFRAVDKIAANPDLREFWLLGSPVLAEGVHPSAQFGRNEMAPYPRTGEKDNRWRVLEVSTNPPRSTWTEESLDSMKMKVWAVAVSSGDQALVYAWSPAALRGAVQVLVPGFGTYAIDAPQPSGYWLVRKGSSSAKQLLF